MDDSRQILSPPKATKIDDLSHTIQAGKNLAQRHRERTVDQLPKDMRLAIIFSMCPTDLEKEITAQQHLILDYAQMRAHIATAVNSRTRGPVPMMMGNLNEEASNHDTSSDEFVEGEDGELYRLEARNGKKHTKGGGKNRTDKECFRCGRIGQIRADCSAKTHSAPKGKGVGSCEEEDEETSQNVPLGTIHLGSFEVLSDHGDTEEDGEQSDVFQQADPWARNAPKSISSAKKGYISVNFPACSVCQKLGVYS